jgi:hypothetical protein
VRYFFRKIEKAIFDRALILQKFYNPPIPNYPTYDQELFGVVCEIKEWRYYIEGSATNTVINDHATLRHLPTQESLGRRHAIRLNNLSLYLALNPRTNRPVLKILYRKGPSNEADALSRRPEIVLQIIYNNHRVNGCCLRAPLSSCLLEYRSNRRIYAMKPLIPTMSSFLQELRRR